MNNELSNLKLSFGGAVRKLNELKTQRTTLQEQIESLNNKRNTCLSGLGEVAIIYKKALELNMRGLGVDEELKEAKSKENQLKNLHIEIDADIEMAEGFQMNLNAEIFDAEYAATIARDMYCVQIQQSIIAAISADHKLRDRFLELRSAMSIAGDGIPFGRSYYVDWESVLRKAVALPTDQVIADHLASFAKKYDFHLVNE